MNKDIKNLIGIVTIIAAISLAYSGLIFARAYNRSSEPANFRNFTVQASGSATGTPDIATFSFSVLTEGDVDLAKLQSDNAAKMNATLEYIKGKGIEDKDITTKQYNIQPRYESVQCDYALGKICPPAEIVGYSVSQSADVKVRDFNLLSGLLSGVVSSGANTVSQLQFTIDDPTKLEAEARAEAIEKAEKKAYEIAQEAGFSIGRILNIYEDYYYPIYAEDMRVESLMMDIDGGAIPGIEPGEQEVSSNLSIQYEIN